MAAVCPTVTAYDESTYRQQMELVTSFAKRIHIDLMDGDFAPTTSPSPDKIWWPPGVMADIHVMYRQPEPYLARFVTLQPHLVIIHAEAEVDHAGFAAQLHEAGIKAGLALLQETSVSQVQPLLNSFDHVMIFSGNLGHHGGSKVDFSLLDKARRIHQLRPDIEIGWDGGVNDQNAKRLAAGGIDALNVGGFIHNATNPADQYNQLADLVTTDA